MAPGGTMGGMILAGFDEAGYGPALGPLVVAGTVFQVPDDLAPGSCDLWKLLRRSAARKPDGRRVAVDDSKKLYSTARGVRFLEEGVLSFLHLLDGRIPADFRGLLRRLSGDAAGDAYLDAYPWYQGRDLTLPRVSWSNQLAKAAGRLAADFEQCGIRFLGARAIPIEVREFNTSLDGSPNKALVSFRTVAGILRWLWQTFPDQTIEAEVDRQGGRMRYGPLLYAEVHPRGIRIAEESEQTSRYELTRSGPPMRVAFHVECDGASFPAALASMHCKYIRELHMTIFNGFWKEHVESLRPTAGYHVDAQRFLADIAAARSRLAIDDAVLIRKK
jgi:hypothetical protein